MGNFATWKVVVGFAFLVTLSTAGAVPTVRDASSLTGVNATQPVLAANAGGLANRQDVPIGATRVGMLVHPGAAYASDRPVVVSSAEAAMAPRGVEDEDSASPGMVVAGLLVLGLIAVRRMGG